MRIYVWEGNRISSSYHNDGTLVVLAESAEQARELVREGKLRYETNRETWIEEPGGMDLEAREPRMENYSFGWDGSDEALDREPDRVVEITSPCVVAFNGGGYD